MAAKRTQIGPKRKIAFVCSGGGTKAGAFHLGVALALQEQGFRFFGGPNAPSDQPKREPGPMDISVYVGSSAGSVITTYLAAGYTLDNIFNSFLGREPSSIADRTPRVLPQLTYQKMFKIRPELAKEQLKQLLPTLRTLSQLVSGKWDDFSGLGWLKMTGLFSTGGIEQFMREEVLERNTFHDYAADLFIVATQLNHSRKVVFGKYHYQPPPDDLTCQYNNDAKISEACAASTSLPFIYSPYVIKQNDRKVYYIDGEIRDTLSSHVAVDAGADLIIASHTHQPYHFTQEIGSLTNYGLPAILVQSIYLLIEQKINSSLYNMKAHEHAIDAVSSYCKQQGIADEHRKKICGILESELNHRMGVDRIYIHPHPKDASMFIKEHFSLSPKKMTEIVKCGFKAAIDALRKHDFADRINKHTVKETKAAGETG